MTSQLLNAIAVAISKKLEIKNSLFPGEYEFAGTVTLHVNVTVKKGEPTTYRPTAHLPLKAVLAIALAKAGIQRGNIANIISEAAAEALQGGEAVSAQLEVAEAALKRVEAMLDKLPAQTREGATRVNGIVEICEITEAKTLVLA